MDLNILKRHISVLIQLWHGKEKGANLTQKEISVLGTSLLNLQRGLTGNRNLAGELYMDKSSHLGAYLLYYWVISYLQISHILDDCKDKIKSAIEKKKVVRFLDFGCGPAPACSALIDIAREFEKDCQIEITLVDYSKKALSIAEKYMNQSYKNIKISSFVMDFEKQDFSKVIKQSNDERFDIAVSCHALNELWKDRTDCIDLRTKLVCDVSSMLNDDGFMILCEPALLLTSRNLIKVRDRLVEKNLMKVVAPCACAETGCPALSAGENHTCHAEYKFTNLEPVSSLAKAAKLDRESVKMTYFVLSKTCENAEKENSFAQENLCGRVVSDGMLNKSGRIRFLVCDGKNRIAVSAKKDDAVAKKLGFFDLKRMDYVSFSSLEIRGFSDNIAYGITEKTQMKHLL